MPGCGTGSDHVVDRILHWEIVQMKRERLVQITRCHMDELVLSSTTGMPTKEQKTRVIRYR